MELGWPAGIPPCQLESPRVQLPQGLKEKEHGVVVNRLQTEDDYTLHSVNNYTERLEIESLHCSKEQKETFHILSETTTCPELLVADRNYVILYEVEEASKHAHTLKL